MSAVVPLCCMFFGLFSIILPVNYGFIISIPFSVRTAIVVWEPFLSRLNSLFPRVRVQRYLAHVCLEPISDKPGIVTCSHTFPCFCYLPNTWCTIKDQHNAFTGPICDGVPRYLFEI